jgi:hypothetical protein
LIIRGTEEFLIKTDDPATCLLEGTANFIQKVNLSNSPHLIPEIYFPSVVFSDIGISFSTEKRISEMITIQRRISTKNEKEEVVPWDEIVYGVKRNPKTLFRFIIPFYD